MECLGEAVDLDPNDSGREEILNGLTNLCIKATYLPTKTGKKTMEAFKNGTRFILIELLLNDEESYRNYLRVTKLQFKFILSLVERDIRRTDTQMRNAISPAEQLAITLRFLASGETFRSLNYQARVSRSCISRIVPQVCESICKRMKGKYLKFPNNRLEWEAKAREFAIKWQFPNCLGALDGKHINFRPLRTEGAYYHNYKGTNSIILMALVDANYKFIYVDIGCNGRCNDAGVFLKSRLRKFLDEGAEIPPNVVVGNGRSLPFVVVGDDAFLLQTHLMKPYPYNCNSREKQIFNARLSRARHVVEHAFGILANRFRIFLSPINLKVETVETLTFTCCVLHNYLLKIDDTYINTNTDK